MSLNDYGDLVETWKVELIVARAKRMGLRGADLEDAQQEVIMDVLNFQYDPNHAKGAKEKTALEVVIDRRLCKFLGKRGDYVTDAEPLDAIEQEPYYCADTERQDMQQAWSRLSSREQEACQLVYEGCSNEEISRRMKCNVNTVKRLICKIREQFKAAGLEPPGNGSG